MMVTIEVSIAGATALASYHASTLATTASLGRRDKLDESTLLFQQNVDSVAFSSRTMLDRRRYLAIVVSFCRPRVCWERAKIKDEI